MSEQAVGSRGTYEYITSYDSSNYNGSATTEAIVVHHWGNEGQKFDNVVASLCGTREASAHYVLAAGKVACIIAPGLRAWHVAGNDYGKVMPGISDVNSHTIGIECRPECTDDDCETLAQLIADLWTDYGVTPVYGHSQFMATACPGKYLDKLEDIKARATAIYNGADEKEGDSMGLTSEEVAFVKQLYANSKATEPDTWAVTAMQQAVANGVTDGERPRAVATRQEVAIMVNRAIKK